MSETRRVINALDRFTEQIVRRIGVNVTAELIRATPVDTGWARANWIPSIAVAFEGNADVTSPEATDVASAGGQQQAGIASLTGYRIDLGTIIIANNVPYIQRLNDGSSAQAPPMFVEMSIERGIRGIGTE